MLLIMRNLPFDIKYSDIKSLIQNKCFIDEVILDKLIKDGPTTKRVTIGVAKEEDATRIKHRLNGTYIGGLQTYVEDVNNSKPGNNSDMSIQSGYRGQNNQNQAAGYQSNQNPWTAQQTGTNQYNYRMPANQTGYQSQQGINQGLSQQMSSGYGAWMTSNNSGIPSLLQNNFMGYGHQQGQSNTSQGQFGSSRPGSQATGAHKELGFGYTSGNSQIDREKGLSNERGYSTQASYSGNQKDGGSWRDSQQSRGRGFQQPPNERDTRGYGSGNSDKDRFGSGNAQKDSRGYGNQQPNNPRGFDSRDSWGNSSRGSGFDRSRGDDLRDGDRKRRHSPEQEGGYRGNSRDRFQGENTNFESNQGRGFDSNRDSRDSYNRAGPSRDTYSAKPTPLLDQTSGPYSWSNSANTSSRFNDKSRPFDGDQSSFEDKPRPFGGDQPRSFGVNPRQFGGEQSRTFGDKPKTFGGDQSRSFDNEQGTFGGSQNPPRPSPENRNDDRNESKSKIVWNSKYQPPLPQKSPAPGPPEKRPKIEETPLANVVAFDPKNTNRAISWRGEGISILAKEIYKHGANKMTTKKQAALKLLKKALNSRIEEIIKQKYPGNPYPPLPGPKIVELYRGAYPPWTDAQLRASCDAEAPMNTKAAKNAVPQPNVVPPPITVNPMGPPSGTTVPQAKLAQREVKPFPPRSPFKPKLSDLLPPHMLQQPPKNKLMLGPNALKKKAKPYNHEKRERTEQKQLQKREFLEEGLYKCPTPIMEKALNTVLDEITNAFNSAVDEHPFKGRDEKLVGETIKQKVAPEFRAMVRLHTIKRILNVTKSLVLRFFVSPGKAPKENVAQALKRFGVINLKSSTQSKTPMFTAGVKSYQEYDKLCNTPGIPCMGRNGPCMITAKPLHLTMPMKYRRLLRQKQYAELTGDNEEKNFSLNIKEEEDDDDDDDDDEEPSDDVLDVTKENEVIELSGDEIKDEKPDVKTENAEISGENTVDEANKSDSMVKSENDEDKTVVTRNTVDLTADDDAEGTVDEKMSAAIAEEMGDSVVEIDEDEIREDDLEDY